MGQKFNEIVTLKKFKPFINIQDVNSNEKGELVESYIITEELSEHFEEILENITLSKSPRKRELGEDFSANTVSRSFIIRGTYGTGKSYFLLVIDTILVALNEGKIDDLIEKFREFDNVVYHLNLIKEKNINYFVVNINGVCETDLEFEDSIRKNLIDKCKYCFGDYESKTAYDEAILKLNGYKNSELWNLINNQMTKMDLDFDELISGLFKNKKNYLNKYQELIEMVFNQPIDIYKVNFTDYLKEASQFIKSKGYTGIAFIFDEFSAYLATTVEDGKINKNLAKIQDLAEAARLSNGNDIVFISSMHKALGQILNVVMADKEDIEKVKGRFNERLISFEKGDKLIENTLRIDENKYLEAKMVNRSIFEFAEKITGNAVKRFLPFHPFSIKYLRLLSQRYAQENRTIFQFMADVVGRKINEDMIDNNQLNLVTPDYVYDYFIHAAAEENDSLMASVNTLLNECQEEWQKKVAKIMIINRLSIYDLNEDIKIGLSIKDICNSLLIRDTNIVTTFLNSLIEKNSVNIFYNSDKELYEFYEGGSSRINITKLVDEKAKDIDEYDILTRFLGDSCGDVFREYVQKGKSGITPVERKFTGNYYTLSKFEEKLDIHSKIHLYGDGTINFIIPKYYEVNNLSTDKMKERIKDYPSNIAVAIPRTYKFVTSDLKRYGAMLELDRDNQVKNDEKTKSFLEREIVKSRRKIEDEIKNFTNIRNFIFVFNKDEIKEFTAKEDLARFILKRYYYKFPDIETENISGRATTNKIIDNFIIIKDKKISSKSSKEEDKHVRWTLKSLDLADITPIAGGDFNASLKVPDKNNNEISSEIFEIIIDEKMCLADKLNLLLDEPFGLPDYLIEVYISAAISLGKVYLIEDNVIKDGISSNLKNIKSGNCELVKVKDDIKVIELIYTKNFWSIISKKTGGLKVKEFDPNKAVNYTNLRIEIGMDIEIFNKLLSNNISLFNINGIEVKEAEDLLTYLQQMAKVGKVKEAIQNFNNIPKALFSKDNESTALANVESLIENVFQLALYMPKVQKSLLCVKNIENNYERFSGDSDSERLFSELIKIKSDYILNPFSLKCIEKLDDKNKELIDCFNIKFNNLHNKLYEHMFVEKAKLNNKQENALMDMLSNIKIKGVKKLHQIYMELNAMFPVCLNKYDEISDLDFNECKCIHEKENLNYYAANLTKFDKEVLNCEQTISGLLATYITEITKLSKGTNDKIALNKYISEYNVDLLETYKRFMYNLNDDPVSSIEQVIEDGNKLILIINEYITFLNIEIIKVSKIPITEINEKIMNSLKHTGKNEISAQEYIKRLTDIIEKTVGNNVISIN
ncbi:MAG TPA: hypothetical protein VIK86_04255 [Candidatus Paceibacterota bacterium]